MELLKKLKYLYLKFKKTIRVTTKRVNLSKHATYGRIVFDVRNDCATHVLQL